MKKISFLIFVLSVCTLIAKAQITDDFESYTPFAVDPVGTWTYYDGDGVQAWGWNDVTVPNLPYTGSCIILNPTQTSPVSTDDFGAHSGNQYLAIFSANPNYMSTTGTTNDWVISPQIPSINSGTLTFWARILTTNYSPETMRILYSTTNDSPSSFTLIQEVNVSSTTWTQYSYSIPAGATYVAINCVSDDKFALFIDDIDISFTTSEATIFASPSAIDFGTVDLALFETRTVSVNGYGLSANIIANTSAPFTLSADGTNFSNSITLPSTGGTLYVRYTPTATVTNTGSVTLFSGANIATISLTGSGFDCGAPRELPYSCTFAANDPELNCWQSIDLNGDADSDHHGEFFFNGTFSSDNDGIAQYFYNESNNANDWMISPLIALGYNSRASFDYLVANEEYPETFSVYIIPEGATYTNSVQVLASQTVTNTEWVTQNINLSAYDNQNIRIAFRVTSAADMWYIAFDNLLVEGDIPPTLTSDVNNIDFGRVLVGTSKEEMVVLTSTHLNEPINVVTTSPFSVSLDGLNFFTNLTIPANPAVNVDDILYVKFAPEIDTAYAENITVTTSTLSLTITMKGSGYICDTITEFTFTEDFGGTSETRDCWDINDVNNDESTFNFINDAAQYVGDATNTADDWLLSPEIALTGNQLLTFEFRTPSTATGKFTVAAISSDTTILITELIEATSTTFEIQTVDLRALNGIYQIGFHCTSDPGTASLEIDNFIVQDLDEPSITANPSEMTFNCFIGCVTEPTESQTAQIVGINLTEDIAVSTATPFEISIDDETYGTEATIAVTGLSTTATLYVRYSPDHSGTHSGVVNLVSGTATATITLNGTAENGGSIDENTHRAIAIYPNPASTLLNVEAEGYDNLQIVNLVGQVVYSTSLNGHTQINVSDLSNGVYFVRLTNDKGTSTQKFIKR